MPHFREGKFDIGYKWGAYEIISKRQLCKGKSKRYYYWCRCDCGNERKIRTDFVNSQRVKSCGCKKVFFGRMNCPRRKGSVLCNDGKLCSKCYIKKSKEEFGPHKKDKDGLYCWCLDCVRDENLQKEYGITLKEYEKILKDQNNSCAVCKGQETFSNRKKYKNQFCVDHSHNTKFENKKDSVRGLLCYRCNLAIGMLGDNLDGVLKAIEYLKRFENKNGD